MAARRPAWWAVALVAIAAITLARGASVSSSPTGAPSEGDGGGHDAAHPSQAEPGNEHDKMLERAQEDADEDRRETEREEHNALDVAVVILLLVVAYVIGQWLHANHVHWLPESGATILVGLLFGLLVHIIDPRAEETESKLYFDPEFFNLFLLPPIIFESGYSITQFLFFRNIGTISTLAVTGTLISTGFTWVMIYSFGQWGWMDPLTGVEAGAFAALISAVDPVATLATFGNLRVDPKLNNLVFGESVLNDAVSLIVFRSILHYGVFESFSAGIHGPAVIASFLVTATGSIIYGVGIGFAGALLLKAAGLGRHGHLPSVEIALFWSVSYFSFIGAEVPHLSGIVSSLFCGIAMQRYAAPNLSPRARVTVDKLLKVLATYADTIVFLLVGLAVVVYAGAIDMRMLLLTLVLILVSRALNVFPLSVVCNQFRVEKVKPNEQVVMWWSGLRGAIAVALAVQVPGPMKGRIVAVTMCVVLFTIFVFGGTTKLLLDYMGVQTNAEPYDVKKAEAELSANEQAAHRHVRMMDDFVHDLLVDIEVPEPPEDEDEFWTQLHDDEFRRNKGEERHTRAPPEDDEPFVSRQKERHVKQGTPIATVSGF